MTFEQGNALINPNTICSNDFELAAYLQMFTINSELFKTSNATVNPFRSGKRRIKVYKSVKKNPIT